MNGPIGAMLLAGSVLLPASFVFAALGGRILGWRGVAGRRTGEIAAGIVCCGPALALAAGQGVLSTPTDVSNLTIGLTVTYLLLAPGLVLGRGGGRGGLAGWMVWRRAVLPFLLAASVMWFAIAAGGGFTWLKGQFLITLFMLGTWLFGIGRGAEGVELSDLEALAGGQKGAKPSKKGAETVGGGGKTGENRSAGGQGEGEHPVFSGQKAGCAARLANKSAQECGEKVVAAASAASKKEAIFGARLEAAEGQVEGGGAGSARRVTDGRAGDAGEIGGSVGGPPPYGRGAGSGECAASAGVGGVMVVGLLAVGCVVLGVAGAWAVVAAGAVTGTAGLMPVLGAVVCVGPVWAARRAGAELSGRWVASLGYGAMAAYCLVPGVSIFVPGFRASPASEMTAQPVYVPDAAVVACGAMVLLGVKGARWQRGGVMARVPGALWVAWMGWVIVSAVRYSYSAL